MNNAAHNLSAVAIVGRPNVGKSAIFNRLIGRKIAIVHDQPGITRDRISGICKRGSRPFVLWDTGGIFGAGEKELTAQMRGAAEEALHESNLLLLSSRQKKGYRRSTKSSRESCENLKNLWSWSSTRSTMTNICRMQ